MLCLNFIMSYIVTWLMILWSSKQLCCSKVKAPFQMLLKKVASSGPAGHLFIFYFALLIMPILTLHLNEAYRICCTNFTHYGLPCLTMKAVEKPGHGVLLKHWMRRVLLDAWDVWIRDGEGGSRVISMLNPKWATSDTNGWVLTAFHQEWSYAIG